MNRQQATQQQIDEIMDTFDFLACQDVLETYRHYERVFPDSWSSEEENFEESLLRKAARECLKDAVNNKLAWHSFFTAHCIDGEDANGPWVRLNLYFGDRSHNDGVTYEKTTITSAN